MCRLQAFVRNGVMIRSEQNYDHDRCGDLYGNKATKAWNPRGCPKGFTMQRRVYGPYRLKGPVLRQGWKQWVDDGCPSLSDDPNCARSTSSTTAVTTVTSASRGTRSRSTSPTGLQAIAKTYSGDEGAARLTERRLRAADDRQGGRGRHACHQDGLEPADSRPGRQVRHLPLRQLCWACWIITCAACRRKRPTAPASGTNTPGAAIRRRDTRSSMACRRPTWTSTTCGSASW